MKKLRIIVSLALAVLLLCGAMSSCDLVDRLMGNVPENGEDTSDGTADADKPKDSETEKKPDETKYVSKTPSKTPSDDKNDGDGNSEGLYEGILYEREGDYIYFGEYPQTLKADNVNISTAMDSRGYYLGSDGAYYAKAISDVEKYYKVEPIKWRILSDSNGTALLMSDIILDGKKFGSSSSNYANSTVRAWLNGDFYNGAFDNSQKKIVETTTVKNGADSTGWDTDINTCENTNDKIFLLSYTEITNKSYGFNGEGDVYDTARQLKISDYAKARGVIPYNETAAYKENGAWWLRSSMHTDSKLVQTVETRGSARSNVEYATSTCGVVPALRIKL